MCCSDISAHAPKLALGTCVFYKDTTLPSRISLSMGFLFIVDMGTKSINLMNSKKEILPAPYY